MPENPKLTQLKELIKLTTNSLTKQEFASAFAGVLDFIKNAIASLDRKYQETLTKLENKIDNKLSQVRDGRDGIDGKDGERGERGSDGRDGKELDPSEVARLSSKIALETLIPQIPKIEQIEQDLPKLGDSIASALELLPDGNKLKIDAIQDLWDELDKLRKEIKIKTISYGVGSSGGGRIVKSYDLSSQLNGVLKSFNLPAFWRVLSVEGSSFPFTYRPTTDYTTSGSTITFTSEIDASISLATGQTLIVLYAE